MSGRDPRRSSAPSRSPSASAATAEILASAIGVLPTLGARLAKLTFAPEILITDGLHYVLEDAAAARARRTASSRWSRPGCRIAASSIGSGRGDATW